MSSFVRIGCRIRRAETRTSLDIARNRELTRETGASQVGFHVSTVLDASHVAKDSFSQTSSHQAIVTRSPNHMWASSCAQTLAKRRRWVTVSPPGAASKTPWLYVTRPAFSIA